MSVHSKVKSYILSNNIGDNAARKIGVEVECFVFDKNYYRIPVKFQINGNFLGYIKFKRALSLSNKMLNFESEKIQVDSGDSTGAIKVSGTLTIVGLADEFF